MTNLAGSGVGSADHITGDNRGNQYRLGPRYPSLRQEWASPTIACVLTPIRGRSNEKAARVQCRRGRGHVGDRRRKLLLGEVSLRPTTTAFESDKGPDTSRASLEPPLGAKLLLSGRSKAAKLSFAFTRLA